MDANIEALAYRLGSGLGPGLTVMILGLKYNEFLAFTIALAITSSLGGALKVYTSIEIRSTKKYVKFEKFFSI